MSPAPPDARARLLAAAREPAADHGTFAAASSPAASPPPPSEPVRSQSRSSNAGGPFSAAWLKRAATTAETAQAAGVRHPHLMYLSYYVPSIAWVAEYKWSYLLGDVVAGVTMASFYIPMALSLSANLAHLPPIHGLYAFAIQPLVYALLGSCPTMTVGPEAAGSLLLGSAIRIMQDHHSPAFDDDPDDSADIVNTRLAGVITAMCGAVAFVAGALRLGFLDSVLSKPLLRGFISGIGFVIFVDQLLPEMGLVALAQKQGVTRASTVTKLIFIFGNLSRVHWLTFAVAATSFGIIMFGRTLKKSLERRFAYIVFLPDRFLVVVFSAVLTYLLRWDEAGLEILGNVEASEGGLFHFQFPFALSHLNHVKETLDTAFLIAVLGFFESVVAAKSLGTTLGVSISSNRELIALGTANIIGGCFQSLPAFGGYGRSKVNKATGGRTPVSSVVLSLCTIVCIVFLLPYFYYLPRCVLCAMISVVAISLLEEAPHDIAFFAQIRAGPDLATMALVFVTTILWSISTGIAFGVGISLIQVIRNSTLSRVQILGRVPGTQTFKPLDEDDSGSSSGDGGGSTRLEATHDSHGVLVVKVRENLTFANAGDMSRRLWRIERYGDTRAHPSLPRLKGALNTLVFDVNGLSAIDGSGAQTLRDTVDVYVARGVDVWFCRIPGGEGGSVWTRMRNAGIVERVGGRAKFVGSVDEALRRAAEADGGVLVDV